MYGSKRDKLHCIQQFADIVMANANMIVGNHVHLTSSEAEYPMELCKIMMICLESWLSKRGATFPSQRLTEDTKLSARQLRQFGKKQLHPLLSEYWLVSGSSIAALFPQAKALSSCPPGLEKRGR